jgi:hypothetical protein
MTAPLWLTSPGGFLLTKDLDSSSELLLPASFLIPAIGFVGLCRIGFGTFKLILATVYYLPVAWVLTALISWTSS